MNDKHIGPRTHDSLFPTTGDCKLDEVSQRFQGLQGVDGAAPYRIA